MESSIKTNRLALISFASGLIALLIIAFIFIVYNFRRALSRHNQHNRWGLMPVRNLCVAAALLTGILGLREIKKNDGTEKGKIFAWAGLRNRGWLDTLWNVGWHNFFLGKNPALKSNFHLPACKIWDSARRFMRLEKTYLIPHSVIT